MSIAKKILEIREYFSQDISSMVVGGFSEKRIKPYLRGNSTIRISSIGYLCPREEAICARDKIERVDDINHELGQIFEFGHAFEDIIRHKIFGPQGLLHGMWECDNCGYVHGANAGDPRNGLHKRIPMPQTCGEEIPEYGKCDGNKFKYIEQQVSHGMFQITGHPDGFFNSKRYNHLAEFKTVNEWRYKSVIKSGEPFPEHKEQATMYAFLTNKKRYIIYYFNKNSGKSVFFDNPVDTDVVTRICNRLKITWKAIRAFERGDKDFVLPDRICFSSDDERCKKCQVSSICFSE